MKMPENDNTGLDPDGSWSLIDKIAFDIKKDLEKHKLHDIDKIMIDYM